ncbi:aromatic acid exporter family protein [Metabacillus litoralis]|uniref:aromatic acid exporter family protein n=1 Tax=Metabacillus litoralis TaxID=152268 RepID=UPI00203B8710|nr:aromatic acid exporter family protein [Metabacillus litoralis]MCM3412313.1 aromatic acid exporter family protein [Metabacillus litoralis]
MDLIRKAKYLVGGRIIKTGIAVFLTVMICEWLNWPAMFAAITAIITIEPTAANSIKKAFVRFPAAAIGAAYSIAFNVVLGDHSYTYALVAIATIMTCHKLRLNEGTLVATLTGVAMISTVHDHFIASFFIRLGATSIGLLVSTLVNLFVMSPNYSPAILNKIRDLFLETGDFIESRGLEVVNLHSKTNRNESRSWFQKLMKNIEAIEVLCRYQKEEWKYHRFSRQDMRTFHYEYKKLNILRQILYHAGNLLTISNQKVKVSEKNKGLVVEIVRSIKDILHHQQYEIETSHFEKINRVTELFWDRKPDHCDSHHCFAPETVIFYELISISDLLEELNHIQSLELRHQKLYQKE